LDLQNQLRSKMIPYVVKKVAGAGFSLAVFFTWMLLMSEFDLYQFVQAISNRVYWFIFFGYGVVCSVGIDLVTWKLSRARLPLRILLYILAGYAIFNVGEVNAFTFIAGTVGALCALLFFLGTYVSGKSTRFAYTFAFAAPLFFLLLMHVDFTEKVRWTEEQRDSTYTARFEYFHGKHEIPIAAEKGQTITFAVDVTNANGGGHGFHVLNDQDQIVGMTEESGGKMKIKAENTGIYRIVFTGDGLKGSVTVTWSLSPPQQNRPGE
jgi:hypothetical protein